MSDRGDDIKATAEELVADARRLVLIEQAKAKAPEDDDTVVRLSEEAADLTEDMAAKARTQLAIATEPQRTAE